MAMSVKNSIRNFTDARTVNTRFGLELSGLGTGVDTVNLSLQLNQITKMIEDSVLKFTKRYLIVSTELEEMKKEFVGQASLMSEYLTLTKKEVRLEKFDKFQQGRPMLNIPSCPGYEQKCILRSTKASKPQSFKYSAQTNPNVTRSSIKKSSKANSQSGSISRISKKSDYNGKNLVKQLIKGTAYSFNYDIIDEKKNVPKNKADLVKNTSSLNLQEKERYHQQILDSMKDFKSKAIYTMITKAKVLPVEDKVKLSFINKTIYQNVLIDNIFNEAISEIDDRVKVLEKSNQKISVEDADKELYTKLISFPTKTAKSGLQILKKEKEKDLIQEDAAENIALVKMIYDCSDSDFTGENSLKESYEKLFKKFGVGSIQELFKEVIYHHVFEEVLKKDFDDKFTRYQTKVVQSIEGNNDLIAEILASNKNKTFSYVAFSLEEISEFLKNITKVKAKTREKILNVMEIKRLKELNEMLNLKIVN